jgi:hypothetical protein
MVSLVPFVLIFLAASLAAKFGIGFGGKVATAPDAYCGVCFWYVLESLFC